MIFNVGRLDGHSQLEAPAAIHIRRDCAVFRPRFCGCLGAEWPYLSTWGNWHAVFNIALLFLVLGAYYGTVLGLDSRAGVSKLEHPVLRAALCGVLASTAVLLVQSWPPHTFNIAGPVTGFFIGAVLGWLGWSWAKFIDF